MTVYPKITKEKPAYAIIISNEKFDVKKYDRLGSTKDVMNLQTLDNEYALNIRFEHTLVNLTADEMVGALKFLAAKDLNDVTEENKGGVLKLLEIPGDNFKGFAEIKDDIIAKMKTLKNFEDYSCLMVFILTHGSGNGELLGRDLTTVPLVKLSEVFSSEHCSGLTGKPKIFFIQACRGSMVVSDDCSEKDQLQFNGKLCIQLHYMTLSITKLMIVSCEAKKKL